MNDPSATPLFPAFPNDPAEHLLGENNAQMMQLELPVAESFPRWQEPVILAWLIYCLLCCSSPPSWTRLKHPGRAARPCGWGDAFPPTTTPAPGKAGAWYQSHQSVGSCSSLDDSCEAFVGSALPNPSQLAFGLGKQWRQDMWKAGEKHVFTPALCLHFMAKRLPSMQSFAAAAFPLGNPKGKVWEGGRRTSVPNRSCCFDFLRSKNTAVQLRWLNTVSKRFSIVYYKCSKVFLLLFCLGFILIKLCAIWYLLIQFSSLKNNFV